MSSNWSGEFITRWLDRAQQSKDPFDQFFSAWIALVIAARKYLAWAGASQPDTDRKAIIKFFQDQSDPIKIILDNLPDQLKWLSQRKGTNTRKAILDVYDYSPKHLRACFDDLAMVWSGDTQREPGWVATATAEMINHVRNNLFHGLKSPNDAEDAKLLQSINPILIGILGSQVS